MHQLDLKKPDGRTLHLYSRGPIDPSLPAPSPQSTPVSANPHYRWHPLRGEWVVYASHRQNRTFLPPKEYNPLLPMRSPEVPTELPQGQYDVAVFENLFPSLSLGAAAAPSFHVPTEPGRGICEVVVFTQDPNGALANLPLSHLELLIEVWGQRTASLGADPAIEYVLPFENKGVEVGVTLHHPHGQIYAYPFIPPIAARELEESRKYLEEKGTGLMEDFVAAEVKDGRRLIYSGPEFAAFVPVCARYTYEVWIAPKRRIGRSMNSPRRIAAISRAR